MIVSIRMTSDTGEDRHYRHDQEDNDSKPVSEDRDEGDNDNQDVSKDRDDRPVQDDNESQKHCLSGIKFYLQ